MKNRSSRTNFTHRSRETTKMAWNFLGDGHTQVGNVSRMNNNRWAKKLIKTTPKIDQKAKMRPSQKIFRHHQQNSNGQPTMDRENNNLKGLRFSSEYKIVKKTKQLVSQLTDSDTIQKA